MKNFFVSLALTVFFISCSNEDSGLATPENKLLNKTSEISNTTNETARLFGGGSISFGIGRTSRNCGGLGICRINKVSVIIEDYTITWTNQNRTVNCNYQKIDDNNFYLLIDRSIVDELREIERGDNFIFEESFTFDDVTTSTIEVTRGFNVAAGSYPIAFDEENEIYKILLTNSR
jgi:hypothetical protein